MSKGRRSKFSAATQDAIVNAYVSGGNDEQAAIAAQIHTSTLYGWLELEQSACSSDYQTTLHIKIVVFFGTSILIATTHETIVSTPTPSENARQS